MSNQTLPDTCDRPRVKLNLRPEYWCGKTNSSKSSIPVYQLGSTAQKLEPGHRRPKEKGAYTMTESALLETKHAREPRVPRVRARELRATQAAAASPSNQLLLLWLIGSINTGSLAEERPRASSFKIAARLPRSPILPSTRVT